MDSVDPDSPAAGTAGSVVTSVGAECTTGRGTAGCVACATGFAFFFAAGFVWRAFLAVAFAFARYVTLCFVVAVVVGRDVEVDGVEAGGEDVTGAGVTTGAGVGAGADGVAGLLCVLPLVVPFEVC